MSRAITTILPVRHFDRMFGDMDRAFDALWGGQWNEQCFSAAVLAPVDIYERDGSIFFGASVPGLKPEELEITVEDNVLTLKGEIKQNWEETDETKVYRREQRYGSFSRQFQLPENLDLAQIDAVFENGKVTVQIPIKIEPKPEPVRVQVKRAGEPTSEAQ